MCEFDFAIERAETTGAYGKPAEHWQRFRDAIRTGTARQVEKFTRRGKSVAWEIDVDTALYRIPNPDVADVVNTIQKMAQKRALVAATLIATSASEFFTQDVEDADPIGQNIETGSHPHGTREAQEFVRDRKLAELRFKPAVAVSPDGAEKPWKNFGEMRQLFEQLREQVGETAIWKNCNSPASRTRVSSNRPARRWNATGAWRCVSPRNRRWRDGCPRRSSFARGDGRAAVSDRGSTRGPDRNRGTGFPGTGAGVPRWSSRPL
jgi:hypothetical protein